MQEAAYKVEASSRLREEMEEFKARVGAGTRERQTQVDVVSKDGRHDDVIFFSCRWKKEPLEFLYWNKKTQKKQLRQVSTKTKVPKVEEALCVASSCGVPATSKLETGSSAPLVRQE